MFSLQKFLLTDKMLMSLSYHVRTETSPFPPAVLIAAILLFQKNLFFMLSEKLSQLMGYTL